MNTFHRIGAGLIAAALVAALVGLVAVGNRNNHKDNHK
jgi:hypothetical protein